MIAGLKEPTAADTSAVIVASGAADRSTTCRPESGSASCDVEKNASGVNASRRLVYFVSFTTPTMCKYGRGCPSPSSI